MLLAIITIWDVFDTYFLVFKNISVASSLPSVSYHYFIKIAFISRTVEELRLFSGWLDYYLLYLNSIVPAFIFLKEAHALPLNSPWQGLIKKTSLKPEKYIPFSPPTKNTHPNSLRKLNKITCQLQKAWEFSSQKEKTHTWIHLGWKPRSRVQCVAYTMQNTIPSQNTRAQGLTPPWWPMQGRSRLHTRKRWFLSSYQEQVQ